MQVLYSENSTAIPKCRHQFSQSCLCRFHCSTPLESSLSQAPSLQLSMSLVPSTASPQWSGATRFYIPRIILATPATSLPSAFWHSHLSIHHFIGIRFPPVLQPIAPSINSTTHSLQLALRQWLIHQVLIGSHTKAIISFKPFGNSITRQSEPIQLSAVYGQPYWHSTVSLSNHPAIHPSTSFSMTAWIIKWQQNISNIPVPVAQLSNCLRVTDQSFFQLAGVPDSQYSFNVLSLYSIFATCLAWLHKSCNQSSHSCLLQVV